MMEERPGIQCSQCKRIFDYAMGYHEGLKQGSGCATFVDDGYVYGAYGSFIYDMLNIPFASSSPDILHRKDNVCDYCISLLIRDGVLLDPYINDHYCPTGNLGRSHRAKKKTFSRLRSKIDRMIREQIVHELAGIDRHDTRYNQIFDTLIITSLPLFEGLFVGSDGHIYHIRGKRFDCLGYKTNCLGYKIEKTGAYDDEFVSKFMEFIHGYPFAKIFSEMKESLLKPEEEDDY